jgi:SOS-response transcriptional repressor LexA
MGSNNFADRLRELRTTKGMTLQQVGDVFGITRASVAGWERGASRPDQDKLGRLAKLFGVSLEYLLHGSVTYVTRGEDGHLEGVRISPNLKGPPNHSVLEEFNPYEPPPLLGYVDEVPLISWVQAGHWAEAIDNHAVGDAECWMPCPKKVGPHAFALRVSGSSMEPKYQNGDIIYLDPDVQAQHGSNVVVRLDDVGEVTFKQLVIEGEEKFLRPLNPDWPGPKFIKINGNATICGVVIGKWSE